MYSPLVVETATIGTIVTLREMYKTNRHSLSFNERSLKVSKMIA